MTITENFERFQCFNFKQIFGKTETCFKKLEYRFLVESAKTEIAIFPYKNALSEVNFKAQRTGSSK